MAPFGHPVCDELVPTALSIVSAIRSDDPALLLDEIEAARQAGGPGWATALIVVLAAMVPVDRTVTQLTDWMRAAS